MIKKLFVFFFLFCTLILKPLEAGIHFDSRDSTIEVFPGSSFYNNSSNLTVDGSLIRNVGANVLGNNIFFSNGYLESETFQALMSAILDPNPDGSIILNGGQIDARPGSWMKDLYVFGADNRIEGQPIFENPITFDSSSPSSLTLAIQNDLSSNILLNNFGNLILEDNLNLADNTQIIGPGTVTLNRRRLSLGGYYSLPWGSPILWDSATDIVLNGSTTLSNTWTFSGIGRINGNGHVLDLSAGGRFVLFPGSMLLLTDIFIRGLGDTDGKGQIVFMDDTAQVHLNNVDIELVRDVTTTLGSIYVEGPTSFIIKDNDWTFSYNATLTVDGVTLWVDTLQHYMYPDMGQLFAPRPLYYPGSLDYNLGTGILDFVNSGTIRIVCDKAELLPPSGEILVDAPLTENLTLKNSQFIHPIQKIQVSDDVYLDGAGAVLYFAHSQYPNNGPQFIIDANKTLTLRNITLAGLTDKTFSFSTNSVLYIGGDVKIELNDNIDFNSSFSWTFSGVNRICGNGHVLSLSDSGRLRIAPGSVLELIDLHIRGLGDLGNGQIIFMDDVSQLRLYNTYIELVSNVMTSQGQVYVEGPTTIFLKDHNWTFSYNANLTVDGVTLWLDNLQHYMFPDMGQLEAPRPVYFPGSIEYDISTGILELINSGTIKIVCDKYEIFPPEGEILLDAPVTMDLLLKHSRFIHPGQNIDIAGNVTIDGNGAILYFAQFFSSARDPQFIVRAGLSVTLRNITLTGLTRYTFNLQAGSRIIIGENVHFEFSDDVVFNSGQIVLQNQTSGIPIVFYMRGLGGRKRITLAPPVPGSIMIALGWNTLALQDIELNGLEFISRSISSDGLFTGAIGLAGDAVVNVEKSTSMAFVISGLGNIFRLYTNNLTFNGLLAFADFGDNVVHFDFVLRTLTDQTTSEAIQQGLVPIVNFDNEFIYLTSLFGIARIIFDDVVVKVNNTPNAFVVADHSFLGCNRIQVAGDPIWDYTDPANNLTRFILEAVEVSVAEGAIFDRAIIPIYDVASIELRSLDELRKFIRPMTALHVEMAKEQGIDILSRPNFIINESVAAQKPKPENLVPVEKPKLNTRPERPVSSSRPNQRLREKDANGMKRRSNRLKSWSKK